MSHPVKTIGQHGQSVWYDNLNRELLKSGELRRMIDEDGIVGVTTNPTIFEKALSSERIYDADLHYFVDTGMDAQAIYEELVIQDVREAADLLLPVFRQTAGNDGYVSLEVPPALALDCQGTIDQAKRLFDKVARKNLMIKVPATPEGFKAVEELIGSGININITLIFSLEQYRGAADAYIKGLDKLKAEGGDPAGVRSVASFFVSRVDSVIDNKLKESADPGIKAALPALLGKAAIANAKVAYSIYKEIFYGRDFEAFKSLGAQPQRIVWASTSTKNPDYPDTYYVDALIGPETVNTIPAATFQAYRDHGDPAPRLEEGLPEAGLLLKELESLGINISLVMNRLLEEGIKSFDESFNQLIYNVSTKRTRLLRGWGHRSASLGELKKPVDDLLSRYDRDNLAEQIWNCSAKIWTEEPDSGITQRLGWLFCLESMKEEIQKLTGFANEIKSEGFTAVVLLGMGGSSLTSEVLAESFGKMDDFPRLKALDTTLPKAIISLEKDIDLPKTLFIVASKSGGTIEVAALYKYFRSKMDAAVGADAGNHFIAITDPGTSLGKLATDHGFRKTFLNPPDIGGRFSALSYFGLVPAALMGIDIDRFLMRSAQAVEACGPEVPALESPGVWLGTIMGVASLQGVDKLTFVISPQIESFGLWLEQLIAESTGKLGKGILPIVSEPLGTPDVFGNDRLFVYLRMDGDETHDQKISLLEANGRPVVTQRLHHPYDIGREMFRWEFSTAVSGVVLKINPFDQPDVQSSKDVTKQILAEHKKHGKLRQGEFLAAGDPAIKTAIDDFLKDLAPGQFVAINAFITPVESNESKLQKIRTVIRDRYKVATTLGFGPRYLHSTGQFHKGGPNKGAFILITSDDGHDIKVPGESYTFGVLKDAQAIGDYEALKKKGRPIIRIHLRNEGELDKLVEAFEDK